MTSLKVPDETNDIAQLKQDNAEMKVKLMQLELAVQALNWILTKPVQATYLEKLRAFESANDLPPVFTEAD